MFKRKKKRGFNMKVEPVCDNHQSFDISKRREKTSGDRKNDASAK